MKPLGRLYLVGGGGEAEKGHNGVTAHAKPVRPASISVNEMRGHIDRLVNEYDIVVSWCRRLAKAWGAYDLEEICIAPIKSPHSYATALHEIGHIKGRFQRRRYLLVRERYAWNWAKRNALVWTAWMERHRVQALRWYEDQIRQGKIGGICEPDEIPPELDMLLA